MVRWRMLIRENREWLFWVMLSFGSPVANGYPFFCEPLHLFSPLYWFFANRPCFSEIFVDNFSVFLYNGLSVEFFCRLTDGQLPNQVVLGAAQVL